MMPDDSRDEFLPENELGGWKYLATICASTLAIASSR